MRVLLIIGTLVEIALVFTVLAVYLIKIARSLRSSAAALAKVSFGVAAIETECAPIGPSVVHLNDQLRTVAGALGRLAELTARPTRRVSSGPSRSPRRGPKRG